DRGNARFQGAAVLVVWVATLLRPRVATALDRTRVSTVHALEGAARATRTSLRLRVGPRTSLAMAALLLAGCSFGRVSDPALLVRARPSPTIPPAYTLEP